MKIEVLNVSKVYNQRTIVAEFSHVFSPGVSCLQGRNGSGKSTLLRILAGIDREHSGSLSYGVANSCINEIRTFLPDMPAIYPNIRGREFLEMIAHMRKISADKYIERYRSSFRLDDLLGLAFKEMSLGQKKKLFATVTLIDEAKVWILDEPTNGLDTAAIDGLKEAMLAFSTQGIVILAEHKQEFLRHFDELKVVRLASADEAMASENGR